MRFVYVKGGVGVALGEAWGRSRVALGLIWGGSISRGLRVFKGMLFVCFGLDVGWFRVGLGWFRVGLV